MDSDNFLLTIAVIAVLVSIVGISVTYNSVSSFQNILTGYATENGTVNITINSSVIVNITSANYSYNDDAIDWGQGTFTTGSAFLCTNGTVSGGTWDEIDYGFNIENEGNKNVTLNVSSTKTAAEFLGGSSPIFQFNVTENETGACETWYYSEGTYTDFSTDVASGGICAKFLSDDNSDVLRMDVCIGMSSDVFGVKGTYVVLTYDDAGS